MRSDDEFGICVHPVLKLTAIAWFHVENAAHKEAPDVSEVLPTLSETDFQSGRANLLLSAFQ